MIKTKKTNNIFIYEFLFLFIIGIFVAILLYYQSTKVSLNVVNYKNWFSIKQTNGFPPYDMNSCTVILGAKLVGRRHFLIDPLAALSGARHFFVNYFINQSYYGIIEGGFLGNNFGYNGLSIANVKPYAWDHGGLQWKVPTRQCQKLIFCLQLNTIRYDNFSLPYHFLFGPNSNSFMWWVFNQCSIKITPIFVKYPFVGIDYFWTREISSKDNSLR